MNIGNLTFKPILENKNLVPKCIYDFVSNWDKEERNNLLKKLIAAIFIIISVFLIKG